MPVVIFCLDLCTLKYAHLSAQTEVDGEINQIKVAADIGFRYFGKNQKLSIL